MGGEEEEEEIKPEAIPALLRHLLPFPLPHVLLPLELRARDDLVKLEWSLSRPSRLTLAAADCWQDSVLKMTSGTVYLRRKVAS